MTSEGTVAAHIEAGVGIVRFGHPKGNSLPGEVLRSLASTIDKLGADASVRCILLQSEGDKTFCGGASFDEFKAAKNLDNAKKFFSGFMHVILAMRRAPKFVISRVQGKAVGGGVGLVAASDYALATEASAVRLSELAIGIGPFIIGPAVQRKVGLAAFNEMAIDADWRDAAWAKDRGLYAKIYPGIAELDKGVKDLSTRLSAFNPEAMSKLKKVLWEGTEDWEKVLPERVGFTSELSLTEFVQSAIKEK